MKATVALLLFVAAAAPASAQVGRVAGVITDEAGRPLRGATVTAENREFSPSTISASSDAKGRYSILGLKRGRWLFTIQAPGYEPMMTPMEVVTIRPNPPLNVKMIKGAVPSAPGPLTGVDATQLQTRLDRASELAAAGDIDAAIAEYRHVLTQAPALTSVHMQIGALLERKQDTAAALAVYRELLRLEPANARAQAAIARLSSR